MYGTVNIILKEKNKEYRDYCSNHCKQAKLFKNAVIFRLRQLFFAWTKDYNDLSEHELQVLNEFEVTYPKFKGFSKKRMFPGSYQFERMFRDTNNPDFFNDLPQQSSVQIIDEVLVDFKSYFKALKKYKKDPSSFTGKPELPKYIKSDEISFDITNQDAVLYGNELKLPKTKTRLSLGNFIFPEGSKLKEVTVSPYYDTYKIEITYEYENINKNPALDVNRVLGLDLGINNIVTSSNNCGLTPFIVKGNKIKALNQWYNKRRAEYLSKLMTLNGLYSSKRLDRLDKYRNNYTTDFFNKTASFVVKYCLNNNIGTIVIGKNHQWKDESNLGAITNQNFCFIAHSFLIKKIEEMALKYGIVTIVNEESYTSKASFLDFDDIPVYKPNDENEYHFSGRRVKRGLYKSKDGTKFNADVNGASNIIRKTLPQAFDNITDFSYLIKSVEVINII